MKKPRKIKEKFVYQRKFLENLPIIHQKLNTFKSACLKSNSLVFSDERLEIHENRLIFQKQDKKFLKILMFFSNKSQKIIKRNTMEFYAENGLF